MSVEFSSIQNHHEQAVFDAVRDSRDVYPTIATDDLLVDVACVALNRLPARYIRHRVDFTFYLTDRERCDLDRSVAAAVKFAFEFVQARVAMRARR
jgi:hypothetical protein